MEWNQTGWQLLYAEWGAGFANADEYLSIPVLGPAMEYAAFPYAAPPFPPCCLTLRERE